MDFLPVVQILDAPVPQMRASIPAVLQQGDRPALPEACVVEHVARVRVPQMSFPSLDVPKAGLQDPTDMILLELEKSSRRQTRRQRRRARWRRKCWICSTNPSIATLASAPDASACTPQLGVVNEDGAARSHTANTSSILALFEKPSVGAPAPPITVEFIKDIVQQVVAAPVPRIMGNSWQLCRLNHRRVAQSRARSQYLEETVEVAQLVLFERIVAH